MLVWPTIILTVCHPLDSYFSTPCQVPQGTCQRHQEKSQSLVNMVHFIIHFIDTPVFQVQSSQFHQLNKSRLHLDFLPLLLSLSWKSCRCQTKWHSFIPKLPIQIHNSPKKIALLFCCGVACMKSIKIYAYHLLALEV